MSSSSSRPSGMQPLRHAAYQEWLGLEMDGDLAPAAAGLLERHLESCAECRVIRRALGRLAAELDAERQEARLGFVAEVTADLPPAAWQVRRPSGWLPAVALSLLLLGVAALLGLAVEAAASGAPPTLLELARASLGDRLALALGSWRALALALGRLMAGSKLALLASAVAVLALDLLLVRLWLSARRRRGGGA